MSPTVDRKRLKTKAAEELARAEAPAGSVKPEPNVFEDDEAGQQGEARARYVYRTMADAFAAPKFIPQRIRGILPAKGLSLIYGDPGSLKSMLALHCAVGVALGRSILPAEDGTGGVPVRRCRVLVLDSDNGNDRMDLRLAALARGYGVERAEDLPYLRYGPMMHNGTPITIDTPAGLEALRWAIDDAEAEMVVLDSYGGAMGAADMNKPEMQRHLGNLRRLAETLGIVVWGIHHSNKTGGMLGTQYFLATADMPLEVRRPDIAGDLIEISPKKIRDAGAAIPAATWWHESTPAVDEFGYEVSLLIRAGFRADATATANVRQRGELAERIVLQVLKDTQSGLSQQALVATVHANMSNRSEKVGERHIRDVVLPSMTARGLLRMSVGRHNAKVYVLGPAAAEVKP
jgi:hypothetical protein